MFSKFFWALKLETFINVIFNHFHYFLIHFSSFLQMSILINALFTYIILLKIEICRNEEKSMNNV